MWTSLPSDLLSTIFSFLPPDSLARASSVCWNWNTSAALASPEKFHHHPPWFIALPARHRGFSCYAHNPATQNWHALLLDFLPHHLVRPVAAIGGLVLLRLTSTTTLQLAICNLFTRQFKPLPSLNITRTNPAIGVIEDQSLHFRIYVAGGMSEGGASYEPALEMYDSRNEKWKVTGSMPVEFAVRLTVWTPQESVYSSGVHYWITSARAYSVMSFEVITNTWREFSVPMADRLEFAALVRRSGRVTLVGGKCGGDACIWELEEEGDDNWGLIGKVPVELGVRFLGGKKSWVNTKCVGMEGVMWLYKEIGTGMVGWRRKDVKNGGWEWIWVEGCRESRGKHVESFPIKGLLLHPNLSSSSSSS